MKNHTFVMLKKVYCYNLLLAAIFSFIGQKINLFNPIYVLLGLSTASINLLINTLATYKALLNETYNKGLVQVSSIARILFVCVILMFLLNTKDDNVFMFIGGYSLQFISIIVYSLELRMMG